MRPAFPVWLVLIVPACTAFPLVALGQAGQRPDVVWVAGTVRDEAGEPVAGAAVYLRGTYHGAIRSEEVVRKAVANDAGEYAIEGSPDLPQFSGTLVAHVPGRPPALAWLRWRDPDWDGFSRRFPRGAAVPPQSIDLTIPSRGGTLEVQVFRDGQLAVGTGVAVRLERGDPFDSWGRARQGPERDELLAIARPAQRTDADGVARFEALPPGLYSIFAGRNEQSARSLSDYQLRPVSYMVGATPVIGESRHIAVRVGQTTVHRLGMTPHDLTAKFNVLRDGRNWLEEERLQARPGAYPIPFNAERTDTYRFDSVGLKRINFTKYTGSSSYPRTFPFDEAETIVAVSPRLKSGVPVTIAARENRGGTVVVRMVDADGQPLEGVARFGRSGFRDVTKEGVRIAGLEPGTDVVEGRPDGVTRMFPSREWSSMPPEEELKDRTELLSQQVTVAANEVVEVTLRTEKVGYIRGRVLVPEGRSPDEYYVYVERTNAPSGAGVFYKPHTAEYLAGPFRAGSVTMLVVGRQSNPRLARTTVAAEVGEVTLMDLPPPPPSDDPILVDGAMAGRVVHTDGSPAWMAAVATFDPARVEFGRLMPQPQSAGMTDAGGNILARWFVVPAHGEQTHRAGPPEEPVAIAWLPGHAGATIVPLPRDGDEAVQITLPPSIVLRGKVAVAGEGPLLDNGTVVVRAQHEGRGMLDNLLSVETTASVDGSFELAGLTPGTYRVQAALDGIWLSPSVAVTVGQEPPEPIALVIPPPGGPVLVRLTPAPPPGRQVALTVDRPEGPLRDRLWNVALTPDGAGVVRIPALEAGRHTIRVGDVQAEVEVPALSESAAQPVETTLSLGDPP